MPIAYVQQPCGHIDVIQAITRLTSDLAIATLELQCWHCRRPVTAIQPIESVVQVALLMASRPKLEKLALAHRIETTSRQEAKQ